MREEVGDNIGTLIVESVDVEALEAPDALQRPELRRHLGRYVVSGCLPESHSAGLPARAASGLTTAAAGTTWERLMTNHGRCIRATASPRIETERAPRSGDVAPPKIWVFGLVAARSIRRDCFWQGTMGFF